MRYPQFALQRGSQKNPSEVKSMVFTDAHRDMIHRLWDPIKRKLGHSSKHRKEEVSTNLVNNLTHGVKGGQELC